jgi:hypothetical protein
MSSSLKKDDSVVMNLWLLANGDVPGALVDKTKKLSLDAFCKWALEHRIVGSEQSARGEQKAFF